MYVTTSDCHTLVNLEVVPVLEPKSEEDPFANQLSVSV